MSSRRAYSARARRAILKAGRIEIGDPSLRPAVRSCVSPPAHERITGMPIETIVRLTAGVDTERLQRFLERCSDYYVSHEGWSTPSDAAEHELSGVPPGSDSADLHVFAMTDAAGDLVGVVQLLRDYPTGGTWWIGLLLVGPSLRGRGIGSRLLQYSFEFVRSRGGRHVRLAVSSNNAAAYEFWRAAGFHDAQQRRDVTARSGHVDTVRIMSREIAAI